jgi:hypothetical protein
MLFLVRSYRRFPLQWFVTIRVGPFQGQGQGIVWNLPVPAFDFLAIWPCDEEKLVHLRSHSQLSNASRFLKQWGDGRSGGVAMENFLIEPHTHDRLQHFLKRLV